MRLRFEGTFSGMWPDVCRGVQILVSLWVLLSAGCQPALVIPAPETSGLSARITAEFSLATTAVRAHPRSATDWGHFGQLCMAHQFSAEALSCFRTAANLAPQDPRWPYLQGVLLEESDLEQSLKCYANAVAAGGNTAISIIDRVRFSGDLAVRWMQCGNFSRRRNGHLNTRLRCWRFPDWQ